MARTTCGGDLTRCVVDVNKYAMPQGPTNQMQQGPGLHGNNYGNGQQHSGASTSGRPGLHGDRHGNSPSQGRR